MDQWQETCNRLCSWIEMCAVTWSPWLFSEGDRYTVVDYVDVDCHMLGTAQANVLYESLCRRFRQVNADPGGGCAMMRIPMGRDRYREWERVCGFAFEWQPLTLIIHTRNDGSATMAYFTDKDSRQSRHTFYINSEELDECGPQRGTAHPGAVVIPWLMCVS